MTLLLLLLVTTVHCVKEVSIFSGVNPYGWDDDNMILYDSKGFFTPMLDLVQEEAKTKWIWDDEINVDVVMLNESPNEVTRDPPSGPSLQKIFEMKRNDSINGIIGLGRSSEGAFGAEMCDVVYIHTYADSVSNMILETTGEEKIQKFNSTVRIGPTMDYVSNAALDVIDWIDATVDDRVSLMVFHENSFASEKIAADLKIKTKYRHKTWKISSTSFASSVFDGAGKDKSFLFSEKISKLDFFDTNCKKALTETRGELFLSFYSFNLIFT